MKISPHTSFDEAEQSTHVIGVFQAEEKGSPRCSHKEFEDFLAKPVADDVFKGRKGQINLVLSLVEASPNLLFVGLGKPEAATGETFRVAGAHISKRLESEKVKSAAVDLPSFLTKGLK